MSATPFTRIETDATSRVIVICDHARNAVPPELPSCLGLPPAQMERHIAYDIGAEGVTRALVEALGGVALLANWSRIVIDPNRSDDDPTLMRKIYDGAIIPGNRHAGAEELERRKAAYYQPYHDAIEAEITRITGSGLVPLILSVHSFTPQIGTRALRPWHIGILWDEIDGRLARPLITSLAGEPGLVVGDNEPYAGTFPGDTMESHVYRRGLPGTLFEIRQDLIVTSEGQAEWGARMAHHIAPLLDDPALQTLFPREQQET
ncbi:MAG: N-formylglutamate amidohydrolase [Pseudomonadota bacterium]